ncbi:unnamed protein product [Rodentolepis nana]|uniref:Solute carrier family 40 protein n=1 Tax=Rodentolepis nana TaxID=102285 RepID=A0A0R3TL81_RODNA|nr:unnamed protein product [Rodentolepis nana]
MLSSFLNPNVNARNEGEQDVGANGMNDTDRSAEFEKHSDTTATPIVNPRDLICNKAFIILWLIQLFETFPTTTLLSVYKEIGTTTVQGSVFINLTSESSTAFLLADSTLERNADMDHLPRFDISMLAISTGQVLLCVTMLLYIATARAFGVKYLSINFPCVYTASIFGRIASSYYTAYHPFDNRPDFVLYICASLNTAALIIGIFLPDKGNKCCQSKARELEETSEIELSKTFTDE